MTKTAFLSKPPLIPDTKASTRNGIRFIMNNSNVKFLDATFVPYQERKWIGPYDATIYPMWNSMSSVEDVDTRKRISDRAYVDSPFLQTSRVRDLDPAAPISDENDAYIRQGGLVICSQYKNSQKSVEFIHQLRQKYPTANIAGGSVSTPYAAMRHLQAGANWVYINEWLPLQGFLAIRQAINTFGSNAMMVYSDSSGIMLTSLFACGVDIMLCLDEHRERHTSELRNEMYQLGIPDLQTLAQAQLIVN